MEFDLGDGMLGERDGFGKDAVVASHFLTVKVCIWFRCLRSQTRSVLSTPPDAIMREVGFMETHFNADSSCRQRW